jgi:hypothetical protein
VPRYDVKVFPTSTEGQLLAVVAVEPIDVPPCMSGGTVFVRVAGQTVPVLDPALLRSLFASGDAARERAAKLARTTATSIYKNPLPTPEMYALVPAEEPAARVAFGLALAPVGWSAARGRIVFTPRFSEALQELVAAAGETFERTTPAALDVSRAWVQGTKSVFHGAWVARVYARGAAAVAFSSDQLGEHIRPHEVMHRLEKASKLAADLMAAAGAEGEARLALHLETTRYPPSGPARLVSNPQIDVTRPAAIDEPSVEELDSIRRELEREAGQPSWEPGT